jgi:hypothetical protein
MSSLTFSLIPIGLMVAAVMMRLRGREVHTLIGVFAVASWTAVIDDVLSHDPIRMAIEGALALWWTWLWWNNRNGQDRRAARELGEKSRARIRALVTSLTPSPAPSPAGR